jgi:uncharacterized phage protein (TIGR02218 family)
MAVQVPLAAHLAAGTTTLCRCWAVIRKDGVRYGFTDHDRDITFEGFVFRADTGLTGQAFQQTTGLSVDNGEAVGALNDASVTEADLLTGRFDNAEAWSWLVNWNDPTQRHLLFRGSIGEVQSGGGGFRAELRGLTEKMVQPQGRVYQKLCSALLGDAACGVPLASQTLSAEATVSEVNGTQEFLLNGLGPYAADWFARGRLAVLSGAATGLTAMIKSDQAIGNDRTVRLWQELRAQVAVGDRVQVQAGCDKRAETCRNKFNNFNNFRGFPHIPGEDWLSAYPKQTGANDGGSRN